MGCFRSKVSSKTHNQACVCELRFKYKLNNRNLFMVKNHVVCCVKVPEIPKRKKENCECAIVYCRCVVEREIFVVTQ